MKVKTNGISIHYQLEGPQDRPVVVMSHSLATDLYMWNEQMATLNRHFRVLRYDIRGHGQTDAPTSDYTLELLATDMFSLLDTLRIDTVHFVGLSLGGMIGQTAALLDQQRFLSLSLCATSSRLLAEAAPLWEQRIATAQKKGMQAMVESTIDRWFSPAFQKHFALDVDRIRTMICSTPLAGYCGCSRAIMQLDLTDQLSSINLPTLLIVGRDDPGTPVSVHETIHQRIAHSALVVVPNARHLVNIEQQGKFNSALKNFLEHST